jgi:membrane protease YdiL (CAAX protease family)
MVVRRHPLIAFFVLAYVLTWWIYPLLKFSPLLGLFGLFGPALAAIIMATVTGGKAGVKALLSRVVLWRVGLPWYVIALGLPTVLSAATAGLSYLLGASKSIQVGALTVLELVLFVLVVGEELGWRGYALPLLLEKRSAVTASLILGVLWGLWHLPTFVVPGTPQYGLPLAAFVLLTIEYSILMTWVFLHTLGSVLIATLFHGARAFYDRQRARGATHYQALRALANRLVGILHACLRTHTLYYEHHAWHTEPDKLSSAA